MFTVSGSRDGGPLAVNICVKVYTNGKTTGMKCLKVKLVKVSCAGRGLTKGGLLVQALRNICKIHTPGKGEVLGLIGTVISEIKIRNKE